MIQERIHAGLARAAAESREVRLAKGTKLGFGRPKVDITTERAVRTGWAAGKGILKVALEVGVGSGTVQRIRREKQQELRHEGQHRPRAAARHRRTGLMPTTWRTGGKVHMPCSVSEIMRLEVSASDERRLPRCWGSASRQSTAWSSASGAKPG